MDASGKFGEHEKYVRVWRVFTDKISKYHYINVVYIHPCYTKYIHVVCNKRRSMQRCTRKRCSIKLKEVQ